MESRPNKEDKRQANVVFEELQKPMLRLVLKSIQEHQDFEAGNLTFGASCALIETLAAAVLRGFSLENAEKQAPHLTLSLQGMINDAIKHELEEMRKEEKGEPEDEDGSIW